MEKDRLLSGVGASARGRRGQLPRSDARMPRAASDGRISTLTRQNDMHPHDPLWSNADVGTAISRDLVVKAERWKQLAEEPLSNTKQYMGHSHFTQLPEVNPAVSHDVDEHEVASYYVKDALAGRESTACIHDRHSLSALKIVRNKAWNQVLNVCTILHLALPMLEIQRCLPCMGVQGVSPAIYSDSLHVGWRTTLLGSMWLECALCALYVYDLFQVALSSSNDVHERIDTSPPSPGANGGKDKPRRRFFSKLPPWQLARTCMVVILGVGLLTNIVAHYIFRVTWHRWSRVTLPFLFISRRTYLKHFVGGMIRVLPRMLPVLFLMSFVIFFYAFLGYIVFRDAPRDDSFLGGLDLFSEPSSSASTFLRMFTSIPFMLDAEQIYFGKKGIQIMGLSYGVIMVIFLGALVPAVANRNFQYQSKESYAWVVEQRKLALTRAYQLIRGSDGTVGKEDWVQVMAFMRPDCDREHTSALYDAAHKAEATGSSANGKSDGLSKGGFFMLCALGKAHFSKRHNDRAKMPGIKHAVGWWGKCRRGLNVAWSWSLPGMDLPLSRTLLNLAVVVQGYQIVREGDDLEGRPGWAYPLGRWLIYYFVFNACVRMIVEGPRSYLMQWRHALGMVLNLIGVAFYMGLWDNDEPWRSLYHILQASRLVILWQVLHWLGPTSKEVAQRLEFVFPAVLRASFVLFSVTYSYAVVAYALYCSTPLGVASLESAEDDSMMQRWKFYKDVISFASLHQSFASMTDVIMLSNWPIFMDAAGAVGNVIVARIFFYSFKGLTFYFVMPVMLGFIVQSYMAAVLPGADLNKPALTAPAAIIPSGAAGSGGKAASPVKGSLNRLRELVKPSPRNGGGPRKGSVNSADKDDGSKAYSSAFGFSTFAEGSNQEIDVNVDDDSEGGSSDDDDAPVMVTSHSRSMSQAFWGAEQAKDTKGSIEQGSSSMQGTLTRLETENASLRALVDSMQMDLQMANARLYDEIQTQNQRERSPSPSRWAQRRGSGSLADRSAMKFLSPEAPSARKRAGSANSMSGMEAIEESDQESGIV